MGACETSSTKLCPGVGSREGANGDVKLAAAAATVFRPPQQHVAFVAGSILNHMGGEK